MLVRIARATIVLCMALHVFAVSRSTIGNPKYKAQEDYYDEIQSLKKVAQTRSMNALDLCSTFHLGYEDSEGGEQ